MDRLQTIDAIVSLMSTETAHQALLPYYATKLIPDERKAAVAALLTTLGYTDAAGMIDPRYSICPWTLALACHCPRMLPDGTISGQEQATAICNLISRVGFFDLDPAEWLRSEFAST
jgi:hypothetical protein